MHWNNSRKPGLNSQKSFQCTPNLKSSKVKSLNINKTLPKCPKANSLHKIIAILLMKSSKSTLWKNMAASRKSIRSVLYKSTKAAICSYQARRSKSARPKSASHGPRLLLKTPWLSFTGSYWVQTTKPSTSLTTKKDSSRRWLMSWTAIKSNEGSKEGRSFVPSMAKTLQKFIRFYLIAYRNGRCLQADLWKMMKICSRKLWPLTKRRLIWSFLSHRISKHKKNAFNPTCPEISNAANDSLRKFKNQNHLSNKSSIISVNPPIKNHPKSMPPKKPLLPPPSFSPQTAWTLQPALHKNLTSKTPLYRNWKMFNQFVINSWRMRPIMIKIRPFWKSSSPISKMMLLQCQTKSSINCTKKQSTCRPKSKKN